MCCCISVLFRDLCLMSSVGVEVRHEVDLVVALEQSSQSSHVEVVLDVHLCRDVVVMDGAPWM